MPLIAPRAGAHRTVTNGIVNQFSVSALERADTRPGPDGMPGSGCMRKWWYRYVAGIREDETEDMRRGTIMHGHLERFVLTGQLPPTPITVGKGWHDVVQPDGKTKRVASPEYLGAEMAHKVIAGGYAPHPSTPHDPVLVEQALEAWGLTCAGVKMVGKVDYAHTRRMNNGVSSSDDLYNPPGTIVIGDYKSKNSKSSAAATVKYLLTPDDLPKSIQMAGYGIGAARAHPWASHVRLEHVYAFTERPGPRKVTRLTVIDELVPTWEYAQALGRSIQHAALETDVEKVDANRFACDRFGPKHLCSHAPYCSGAKHTQSTFLFGDPQAAMSLMNNIPSALNTALTPAMTQLAAEEQALRAQAAQIAAGAAPADPNAVDDATFAAAWRHILAQRAPDGSPIGQPSLGNPAAQIYARLCGTTIGAGAGYAGTGAIGHVNAHDAIGVLRLAAEFGWQRPAPQQAQAPVMQAPAPQLQPAPVAPAMPPAAPSIMSPDAPTFTTPNTGIQNPGVQGAALAAAQAQLGQLQPQAPAMYVANTTIMPAAQAAQVDAIVARLDAASAGAAIVAPPGDAKPKRGRGRPKKADTAAGATVTHAESVTIGGYPLEVFVDCNVAVADGAESLDEYADSIVAKLVGMFCSGPNAIPDIRAAGNDTPLGYGKWKAGLAAQIRETPPSDGRYVFHAGADEIRNEIANALRGVVVAAGGLFVDGR